MIVAIIAMMSVLAMVCMANAQTKVLKSRWVCAQEYCKVFTLGKGTLEIACGQKMDTSNIFTNVKHYTCPTVGSKMVCKDAFSSTSINVNPYDTDAIKCQKICGSCSTSYAVWQ